jgi:hypothetical protein
MVTFTFSHGVCLMSRLSSSGLPHHPQRVTRDVVDLARTGTMAQRLCAGLVGALALALAVSPAGAQALNYPSLQVPYASTRDYTGAIAGGDGTTLLFQWREGWTERRHLQLDVGIADRKGNDGLLLALAGSFGQELLRASGEQPLDLLLTGGVGMSFGDGVSLLRVPIGVSIGHTFEMEKGMSLTPYVHPRVSIDVCSSCGGRDDSQSELSLNFDLGVNFQVNRQFAVRTALAFSGSDLAGTEDSFAVGFVWTPRPLVRTR